MEDKSQTPVASNEVEFGTGSAFTAPSAATFAAPQPANMPTKSEPGWIKSVLGQFTQPDFWKGLLRTLVQDAVLSFFRSAGGALVWYADEKARDAGRKILTPQNQAPSASPFTGSNRTFSPSSSGFTPPSSYSPPTSAYETPFPGFRR